MTRGRVIQVDGGTHEGGDPVVEKCGGNECPRCAHRADARSEPNHTDAARMFLSRASPTHRDRSSRAQRLLDGEGNTGGPCE
jgi:hypothetical protein